MNYEKLWVLRGKNYFGAREVAGVLGIGENSARVFCFRYRRKGLLVRLKRDLYILKERWENLAPPDFWQVANILQVPSYISFMTALGLHEVTTQVQRDFFESACLKRTRSFPVDGTVFCYRKIREELYFGFEKKERVFLATREKAFLDAVYLYSFGKYKMDVSSIDFRKFDPRVLRAFAGKYPERTQRMLAALWRH